MRSPLLGGDQRKDSNCYSMTRKVLADQRKLIALNTKRHESFVTDDDIGSLSSSRIAFITLLNGMRTFLSGSYPVEWHRETLSASLSPS